MEAAWGQDAPRPLQPTEVQVSLLHSQLSKHSAPCITSLGILSLQELIWAWYRKKLHSFPGLAKLYISHFPSTISVSWKALGKEGCSGG